MAKFKINNKDPTPKKIRPIQRSNNIGLWTDLKCFLPIIDFHLSSFVAGIIAIVMAYWTFSKPRLKISATTEPYVNLTKIPFIYDFTSAQREREINMLKYNYTYNTVGVDKRSELSVQEFWDVYDCKWPVVVTDVMNNWPAMNWTTKYLNDSYGDERVVMKAVHGGLHTASGLALPLSLFIQHLNHSSFTTWTYLEDELFLPRRPKLYRQVPRNLYTEEDFFRLFPKEIRPWDCMLLWGTAYSRSSLHIDPYNWTGTNAVIKGHKKIKLFLPGQDELLYVKKGICGFPLNCQKYNSELDTFDIDLEKYPKYKEAKYVELDLYPGEFLLIPPGWFHQAYNVEETIAVSGQIMNRNNYLIVLEEILKAGNLKRKSLPSYFHSLLPPDQVSLLMSMLPKRILQNGKKVNKEAIEQLIYNGRKPLEMQKKTKN